MNIPANELKATLKKLSAVKTDFFLIDPGFITTLDSDVRVQVAAPWFTGPSFSVLARKFTTAVNRMTGDIGFEQRERSVVLSAKKAKLEVEIQQCKPMKRPDIPDWTIILLELKTLLATASATMSKMKSQEFGDVIQLIGKDELEPGTYSLQAVGYDSLILTRHRRVSKGQDININVLVNSAAVTAIQLLDDCVHFADTETALVFRDDKTCIWAAKPAKTYPDYERYFPVKSNYQFQVDPVEAIAALRIVEPLESSEDSSIGLHFVDGVLHLSSLGASDEIDYEQLTPDPIFEPIEFKTAINYKHLQGIVAKSSDKLVLSVTSPEGILRFDSGEITTLAASAFRRK